MKLAWIGSGRIVHDGLYAAAELPEIENTAIFARPHSLVTAQELAEQYKIAEVYTDYEELLQKTAADTVYIGLVNTAHFAYAKKALESGKNVILEKPFVPTAAEARELAALARAKNLCLLEAITVLHLPVFAKVKDSLPRLGRIRAVQCNFSQYSSRYDRYLKGDVDYCFDPAYCGGALYDINVYNLHYCVGLFGRPKKLSYFATLGANGVDTSGVLMLEYDGFVASCLGAKDSDSPCGVTVQGEKGFVQVHGMPNSARDMTASFVCGGAAGERSASGATVRKTETAEFTAPPTRHRMSQEFADFAKIIDSRDFAQANALLDESVLVTELLEQARQTAPGMWQKHKTP